MADIDRNDIVQYAIKILLNSIYGVFGNPHSALYDTDLAGSVTNTGQSAIKQANKICEEYIKEAYDTELDSYVYSDTDSTHISLKPLLDAIGEPLLIDNEMNPVVYEKANELQNIINERIERWANTSLMSSDPRFYFKREAICAAGIYQSKKHYILHIRDKGEALPVPCDYIKYVGVELVKSKLSEEVKMLVKRVVESIVYSKDKSQTDAVYKEVYEEFKTLTPEQIAERKGVNNVEKYTNKMDGFAPAKGTPGHVKSAINYNLLLEELGLTHKYPAITSGNKMKLFYVRSTNKYGMQTMGFLTDYPTEFAEIIKPDYEFMFEKLIKSEVDRFYKCVKWRAIDLRNEYACDLFDILGI